MTLKLLTVLLVCISWAVSQDIHFEKAKEDYDLTSDFRTDYKYVSKTECYYKEHKTIKTWSDAVAICKAEGGELAAPFSKTDAEVLTQQFSNDTDHVWLGIHDLLSEGNFYTLNGTSAEEIYINWSPGEPNDPEGDKDCVTMSKSEVYDDISCKKKFKFICTKHQTKHTYATPCETTDKGYFLEPIPDRCYKLHASPKTWHEAYSICLYEGAHLAMVNSQDEVNIFINNMARYPEHTLRGNFNTKIIWLDFSDILTPGEFQTSKGLSLAEAGYEEWSDGQPNNRNGNEHCGSMYRNGKLNDVSCNDKAYFFCEKKLGAPAPPRLDIKISINSGATTVIP